MKSIEELLTDILELGDGWVIKDMKVDRKVKEIDIFIEYTNSTGYFPETKELFNIYDYGSSRRIRHLDLFEYKCYLNARIPRVKNGKLGVRNIVLKWADERVSFSYLFEFRVIEALLMSKNQTKTAEFFDSSFDIVHSIMKRAVERGLLRRNLDGITTISLDEKSFSNGHNYLTILSDPINKRVLDIIEGRKIEDTEQLLTWTLSPKQIENITLITMDMWKAYMAAAKEILPQAAIIHDKFHTAKYLNKGVDEVRKVETKAEILLKNTKYLYLKDPRGWSNEEAFKFEEIDAINLKTSIAWRIKENFKEIYTIGNWYVCKDFFEKWYKNVLESKLKPMIQVADTLLRHLEGILNSAVHSVSNSIAENINSQIQIVKSVARGFANFKGYQNAVLFFQGKLNLFPL
jgi:transposase